MTNNTLNILDIGQMDVLKAGTLQTGLLESIGQNDLLSPEMQGQSFDMIFGNMLAGLSPELVGMTDENALVTQQSEMMSQLMIPTQDGLTEFAVQTELKGQVEQAVVAENVVTFNQEIEELGVQDLSLKNINIKEILSQQNQELENGQFKVLSKEVTDSKVALTIEGSNGKQLTVSLPIESIQNRKQNLNSTGLEQRVSVDNSFYTKELESLIEKVDIKQIEIKSPETKLSQSALKPVEISLIGEQNASTVTLKASLKKNQIKITEPQVLKTNQKAAVLDESGILDEKVVVKPNQAGTLIENVVKVSGEPTVQNSLILKNSTQQQFQLKETITNQPTTVFNVYQNDTVDNVELKENVQNIRMQLPENINSVLRPNGQAVIIKMNPANLGPAKLSLSMVGGKLRAKLVVSSVNAKQMLDGTMDRLVDQLQKADVIVDKIDVTLDGNKNQQEQFNQNQQWQRKMSQKNISLSEFEQTELEETVQQPMMSAIQPIANGAVNFLA